MTSSLLEIHAIRDRPASDGGRGRGGEGGADARVSRGTSRRPNRLRGPWRNWCSMSLPDDYFDTFASKVAAGDRRAGARQWRSTHLDPDRLATAIVSDSSIVIPQLAAAGLGEPTPLLPRL